MYRVTFKHRERTFFFVLTEEQVVIGSGDDADLRLPVPEVSRRHAEIRCEADGFRLVDLDSRNGTYVGGERIREQLLQPLTEFRLGPVPGVIEEVSTTDMEAGISLSPPAGEESARADPETRTFQPPTGDELVAEVVGRALGALQDDATAASLARHAGRHWLDVLPGSALHVTCDDAVLFRAGELPTRHGAARHADGLGRQYSVRWSVAEPRSTAVAEQLAGVLAALLAAQGQREPRARPAQAPDPAAEPSSIVGTSPPMRDLLARVRQIAPLPINVMILGPSGTGKELFAAEIHACSPRARGPFVAINCAALPRDLLEAELFGVEERVATGVGARPGRFEQAHGGTLFFDEICDMSLPTQAMILRVLQEQTFYRLGGKEPREADVRIVTATNKNVRKAIEEGQFREDLYYRIAGDVLELPPLHERPGDVELLLYHVLERFTQELDRPVQGVSKKALDRLVAYSWPGNVRELENEVRRVVAVAPPGGLVETAHLSPPIREATPSEAPAPDPQSEDLVQTLATVERRAIERAVDAAEGNLAEAARRLGISRPGLYQRMERLGMRGNDED